MRWRKVTLIGVGLLGGSLGLALKRHRLAEQVTGYVRRESSIQECLAAGAVDSATTDLRAAVAGADLVVFCTPLAQMPILAAEMVSALDKAALVTDVGSVKGSVVSQLQAIFSPAGVEFIGSHPMAGSEKMGVNSARAGLFEQAVCVVTPASGNSLAAVERITDLWRSVGSRVMRLSPEEHDRLVSRSSHLPHVLSAALASYVLDPAEPLEQQQLCATGFRDTTRVASGSPEMWRDISLANRVQLRHTLSAYIERLSAFEKLLDAPDAPAIEEFFREARNRRESWGAEYSPASPE